MSTVEIRHFHLFAGLGGGAAGFNDGDARVGSMEARFRCLGGIDVDAAAVRDFERLAGVPGTVLDLFDRDQYRAFHGREPGPAWREAGPADIRRAAGNERPHIVFLSAPCKGFSGLLSEAKSLTDKYQALNKLTLRGVWLALEAWADDPVELFVFENVPRLLTRGRALVDRILAMFRSYGYAVRETTHDCGKLGGLAQSRKRCLIVARHLEKVPPMLYEPPQRALRAVGDVLGHMPLPGVGGPMHRVPSLAWKTWVRLAFVEAGSDWRSLNKLAVENGHLRDFLIVPAMHRGGYGVRRWGDACGVVQSESRPSNGAFSVADPRFEQSAKWTDGQAYAVRRWDQARGAITGASAPGSSAQAVADPRSGMLANRGAYLTGGHYGVTPWDAPSGAVSAAACHDNGRWSVADPRTTVESELEYFPQLPGVDDKLIAVIRSLDGTWHRPFTTLELAALQSLFDPEDPEEAAAFGLDGSSDSAWRERIGNAVPRKAAAAIASEMGRTLLLAWSGETFALSAAPVWVRPVVVGLSLAQGDAS